MKWFFYIIGVFVIAGISSEIGIPSWLCGGIGGVMFIIIKNIKSDKEDSSGQSDRKTLKSSENIHVSNSSAQLFSKEPAVPVKIKEAPKIQDRVCPVCGSKVTEEEVYCIECGNKL